MKKDKDNIVYGNPLRNLRIINNLTQDQVAQLTGFDTKYVSQIENGRYMGTIKTMLKFCEAFNVTPNDILCDFIKQPPPNNDIDKFCTQFAKLTKKERKRVLALIESMLSD